jgi:CDP-4-dehydro-6-deoxyglucose reductase
MIYDIEILPAGVNYQAGSDDTVLNAAITSKLFLEHSCRKGECGLCSAMLLSGAVQNQHGEIVTTGEILTCSSYPRSDLSIKVIFYPELATIDCITLPCKVVSCEVVADDIVILTLRYPPTVSFNYLSGQYVDLIYKGVRRSYSIANAHANSAGIELHIRLIPGGEFSELLANGCDVDQLMRIEGPKGAFFIRKANNPIIFLAGGTGFAPIKAMVEELLKNNIERTIYIYWGMLNTNSFYTDVATFWAKKCTHVHYVPVVSGEDEAWTGRKGFVHEAVIIDFPDLSQYHVYACGSPLMINSAKEAFISQGLHKSHFYADIFVSSK